MKDFSAIRAVSLLLRTLPFLILRFLVYAGITVAYVLATGMGAGMGFLIGKIGDSPEAFSIWGGIIGFGIVSFILYLAREYLLYLLKAGHIAVLVEAMEKRPLPAGKGQIDFAIAKVKERFTESSLLFGLDQLIKGILRAFNRTFFTITAFLPLGAASGLIKLVNTIVNLSLTFLDEVIIAQIMRENSANPWKTSQTSLVLYAQNYKAFLRNAFFLSLFVWGLTLLILLIALVPAGALVALFPGTAGILTLFIAVVFAWAVKQALIEPFGMVCLLLAYRKVTEGQQPNPEWEAKLDSVSRKFRTLKERAASWQPAASTGATSTGETQPPATPRSNT